MQPLPTAAACMRWQSAINWYRRAGRRAQDPTGTRMRVLLLILQFPPDVNSNGQLMGQVCEELVARGHEASVRRHTCAQWLILQWYFRLDNFSGAWHSVRLQHPGSVSRDADPHRPD